MEQRLNLMLSKMECNKEIVLLKKALERQKKARLQAERILEQKSKELYDSTFHLKQANNKLENLLTEKTSELDGVFVNIIDPYVVMDLGFTIINMNSSARDFLGYDNRKEHINLAKLVHKDYIEYTIKSIKNLMEIGVLKNYRSKIRTKDGSYKWVQINSSLIYDKDLKPIGAQGIIRDITKETEIKELLNEQKKQLDIIVENSPLGIILTVDDKIIKANKAFVNLLNYSENELKQFYLNDISTSENKEENAKLIADMNTGVLDNFSTIKKYYKKDGTTLLAKTNVSVVKNDSGNIEYQVSVIEDITVQKELEIQKEQLLNELEISNKGLQEYAHIVSHDLKSPLRSISALATWIQEDYKDVLDDTGLQNLCLMQEKIASMDKLIHGILEYSTAGSSDIDTVKVDLNSVLSEIKESIYIPDHVMVVAPKKLPSIYADRIKMHQLFQNIISNAVVHIDKEEGLVKILCAEQDKYWLFTIEDNGVGIPEKFYKKIFEIFQSIGENERSTGIGLSIVKKIVDRYQGKVWVESKLGEGTTFYFTIKKQRNGTA